MTDNEQGILRTLAFFDAFNMPLTAEDIFRYYHSEGSKPLRSETEQALSSLLNQNRVTGEESHYRLADRPSSIISDRKQSRMRAIDMLKKSQPWLSCLASWPGVRAISICNNIAFLNASEESDIDLFLIVNPGEIWQTRFALASFLQVFKKRPQPGNEYGKLCLSFIITSDQLDLSFIKLQDDIYLSYWLKTLLPVYDPEGLVAKTKEANWQLFSHLGVLDAPEFEIQFDLSKKLPLFRLGHAISSTSKPIRKPLENWTRKFQQKRFPPVIRSKAKDENSEVIISDSMLKFHTNDRRAHYRDLWKKRCGEII